ncbi:YncE family protein [Kosmotoga pacifica]|uniref:Uncharacterized protein n=1 Tax=Kosmotoga pacifica TaxID=1330330 RepID=A0A0G2Z6C0_9BACT|nr:hypothetical protein [Kosmotoga pacifica]AKI97150.1 hypothetical protein IX53_04230 [Kosmotoga pacifica]
MKVFIWLVLLIAFAGSMFSMKVISRLELGAAPFKIEKVKNIHGTYYIVLLKGTSELLVLDSAFKPLRFIEDVKNEGLNDFIINNEKLYCFGFFSGRLLVIDISGRPASWKIKKKVSTGERIITGTFLDKRLGILSMDKRFLIIDTVNFKIINKIDLPVEALSIIADKRFFYITLFYNFDLVKKMFETDYGLFVVDGEGKIHKKIVLGRRPSYILQDLNNLYVVNYLDGTLDVVSKEKFERIKQYKLGKLPNFPVMDGRYIWVPCIGSDSIYRIDLNSGTISNFAISGSGPIRVLVGSGVQFALSVISGTIEKFDAYGKSIELLELHGYPIDAVLNANKIAVLLQEDWLNGGAMGTLIVLEP